MDALLALLVIAGTLVSMMNRSSKARQKTRASRTPSTPSEPPAEAPSIRPADVDLPRQATMPIERYESPRPTIQPAPSPVYETTPRKQEAARSEWTNTGSAKEMRTLDIPGLNLRLDADTLVKGVIFSEILNRKTPRRMR